MPDLPKDLIKDFLVVGTANGCGDLSIMVSHIVNAYSKGFEKGKKEREKLLKAAKDALRSYQYGNSSPHLAKEIADAIDLSPNQNTKE